MSAAARGTVGAGHRNRGVRAADDGHDRGARARRTESRGPGRHRHREERQHRLHAQRSQRHGRDLPDHGPPGRQLRAVHRDVGLSAAEARRSGQRLGDGDVGLRRADRPGVGERHGDGGERAGRHDLVGRRRGRGHAPRREPPAERAAVRQPRGHDSRRRPRLPRRPDEEHAVLAADQRRQRPERELPDRRRRQQRRHRRWPPPALPARGDPGVQLPHVALQGRVRPQQRRRHEHRHQERHERLPRQCLRAVPRQVDEREDRDGTARVAGEAGLSPQPVRRQRRRTPHEGPRAFLRRHRAHESGHDPGGDHQGALPVEGRGLRDAVPGNPVHRKGDGQPRRAPVPDGAVRPERQLAALRRDAALDPGQLGRQQEQVQLDQRQPQRVAVGVETERVRVPVRRLRQSHLGADPDGVRVVPQRRHRRAECQHAAEHRAEEVPVPRRLLMARRGDGRPRARLQGGPQLHS